MSLKSQTMLRLSSVPGAHLDLRGRVVPVRVLADAVVVEEPMAVAELDALGDGVHVDYSINLVIW